MRLLGKTLLCVVIASTVPAVGGLPMLGTTAASASEPVTRDLTVNVLNVYNNGDDAGNDSWLEVDRSLNLAKGDGSPGSDIINEVGGASSGMSPGSSNGSLTGSFTSLSPGEAEDE